MFLLIIRRNIGFGSSTVISIHLMFLLIEAKDAKLMSIDHFNTSHVSINHALYANMKSQEMNFNTSHVSINLIQVLPASTGFGDFNTSHVSINQQQLHRQISSAVYFNTSHVSINHYGAPTIRKRFFNFNTSHVSINQEKISSLQAENKFQYISCFY